MSILPSIQAIIQSDYSPIGDNFNWAPEILWFSVLGDLLTIIAYLIIPVVLWMFNRKKKGMKFGFLFQAFGICIFISALGQLVEVVNLWEPIFVISTITKVSTGIVSLWTVFLLIKTFPRALSLPSQEELEEKNDALQVINTELQELNKAHEQVLEAVAIGEWTVDLTTGKVQWSDQIYKIHEVPFGSSIEIEEAINFYHPDFRPLIEKAVNDAIESGLSWDEELKILTASGKEVWVRAIGKAVKENGKVVGLKGLFQNINQAKLKSEAIAESEKKLKEAQNIGNFGNWSWDIIKDKLEWSEELYRIFGREENEEELNLNSLKSQIHKDDVDRLTTDVEKAIKLNRPHDLIHRIIRPNGEIRFVHERGKVIYDSEHRPIRMAGTTQDITDRVLAENELKERDLALKEAESVAQLGNWIWYQDEDSHVWSDQRFRILDYEPGEVEPSLERAFETIVDEDKKEVLEQVEKAVENNANYDFEYRIVTAKGNEKVIREKGRFFEDRGLKGKIYFGTVQDVTEEHFRREKLKHSLIALERSNKELQNFAYVASHDLQEPLRVISSYLQLIEMSYKDTLDEEGKLFIDNTVKAAARMKLLINDLLSLSRLETAQQVFEQINMESLLQEVKEDLKIAIDESDANLEIPELPNIKADRVQMKQLFQNLLSNAIKFRKEGIAPEIKVSCVVKTREYQFSIKDNGIGIGEDHFERIFTIFQRLHARDEYEGTGIGLAYCKKIVERHGGSLSVSSETGKGSTFSFSILK